MAVQALTINCLQKVRKTLTHITKVFHGSGVHLIPMAEFDYTAQVAAETETTSEPVGNPDTKTESIANLEEILGTDFTAKYGNNKEDVVRKEVKRRYRITGKQSIERLEPLLHSRFAHLGPWGAVDEDGEGRGVEEQQLDKPVDLVWETTCERTWRKIHNGATILNKLNNTNILEDKSNLAYLQQKISR